MFLGSHEQAGALSHTLTQRSKWVRVDGVWTFKAVAGHTIGFVSHKNCLQNDSKRIR